MRGEIVAAKRQTASYQSGSEKIAWLAASNRRRNNKWRNSGAVGMAQRSVAA